MNIFQTIYSTLSTTALKLFVEEKYNIDLITDLYFLKRGFNDTYLIQTKKNKYILRVYKHNWKNKEAIESEIELLNLLSENQINTAIAIADKNNNYIHFINAAEGLRYIVLFKYAEGKHIRKLNFEQSFLLGTETAKIHLLTQNKISLSEYDYSHTHLFEDCLKTLSIRLKNNHSKELDILNALYESFENKFKTIDNNTLCKGICHGDLQAENFHIENNQITFFDFDFSGNGYLTYDIGVFLWYDHKNKSKDVIESFLKGYQTQKKLSSSEIELIPYFGTLRAIFQMTLFSKTNNGIQLPLWPTTEIAAFIEKINKWHYQNTMYPLFSI